MPTYIFTPVRALQHSVQVSRQTVWKAGGRDRGWCCRRADRAEPCLELNSGEELTQKKNDCLVCCVVCVLCCVCVWVCECVCVCVCKSLVKLWMGWNVSGLVRRITQQFTSSPYWFDNHNSLVFPPHLTQPIFSFEWSQDKEGLCVTTAADQTLRVMIVTRLNLQWPRCSHASFLSQTMSVQSTRAANDNRIENLYKKRHRFVPVSTHHRSLSKQHTTVTGISRNAMMLHSLFVCMASTIEVFRLVSYQEYAWDPYCSEKALRERERERERENACGITLVYSQTYDETPEIIYSSHAL